MTTDLNGIPKRGYKEIIEMTDPFKWKYLPRVIAKKKIRLYKRHSQETMLCKHFRRWMRKRSDS